MANVRNKDKKYQNKFKLSPQELTVWVRILGNCVDAIKDDRVTDSDSVVRTVVADSMARLEGCHNLHAYLAKRLKHERDLGMWALEFHNSIQNRLNKPTVSGHLLIAKPYKPSTIPHIHDVQQLRRTTIRPA